MRPSRASPWGNSKRSSPPSPRRLRKLASYHAWTLLQIPAAATAAEPTARQRIEQAIAVTQELASKAATAPAELLRQAGERRGFRLLGPAEEAKLLFPQHQHVLRYANRGLGRGITRGLTPGLRGKWTFPPAP